LGDIFIVTRNGPADSRTDSPPRLTAEPHTKSADPGPNQRAYGGSQNRHHRTNGGSNRRPRRDTGSPSRSRPDNRASRVPDSAAFGFAPFPVGKGIILVYCLKLTYHLWDFNKSGSYTGGGSAYGVLFPCDIAYRVPGTLQRRSTV
jgi:hypothetical protein